MAIHLQPADYFVRNVDIRIPHGNRVCRRQRHVRGESLEHGGVAMPRRCARALCNVVHERRNVFRHHMILEFADHGGVGELLHVEGASVGPALKSVPLYNTVMTPSSLRPFFMSWLLQLSTPRGMTRLSYSTLSRSAPI